MDPGICTGDRSIAAYTAEAVTDPSCGASDYVNYICPQFSDTDITSARATVDTFEPFIAAGYQRRT